VAGIGVDIVEIARIEQIIGRTPRFVERVFTQQERDWAGKRRSPAATYAGFFAAREAVLKALGVGFGKGVGFADVWVDHDSKGRPVARLAGGARQAADEQGIREVFLSISHTAGLAVANALAADEASQVQRPRDVQDEKAQIAQQFKQVRSLLDELDTKTGE
jgi:holo-[acyl-carrier protein] synthase